MSTKEIMILCVLNNEILKTLYTNLKNQKPTKDSTYCLMVIFKIYYNINNKVIDF